MRRLFGLGYKLESIQDQPSASCLSLAGVLRNWESQDSPPRKRCDNRAGDDHVIEGNGVHAEAERSPLGHAVLKGPFSAQCSSNSSSNWPRMASAVPALADLHRVTEQ